MAAIEQCLMQTKHVKVGLCESGRWVLGLANRRIQPLCHLSAVGYPAVQ